jgi:hypothetical protein
MPASVYGLVMFMECLVKKIGTRPLGVVGKKRFVPACFLQNLDGDYKCPICTTRQIFTYFALPYAENLLPPTCAAIEDSYCSNLEPENSEGITVGA